MPGLTAECFGDRALPLRYAASHVEQLGYEISWIEVDGLSSGARNAAENSLLGTNVLLTLKKFLFMAAGGSSINPKDRPKSL